MDAMLIKIDCGINYINLGREPLQVLRGMIKSNLPDKYPNGFCDVVTGGLERALNWLDAAVEMLEEMLEGEEAA